MNALLAMFSEVLESKLRKAWRNVGTILVLLRLEKGTYICCSLLNQRELEMNALFAMFSEVFES